MSEAGFTPGPWNRNIKPASHYPTIYSGRNKHVAVLAKVPDSEMEGNADLIAAAPDLYDAADNALNALVACCVPAGGVDDRKTILEAQAMLRAAINKALGK